MTTRQKSGFISATAARHGRPLLKFFVSRLKNAADAPDLLQEVYLRILRIDHLDLIRCPEAYLFTIAAHIAQEHNLKQSRRPIHLDIADASSTEVQTDLNLVDMDTPEEAALRAERIARLERVLAQLSPKARAALVLHRRDGRTYEEISKRLGVSRNMVKKYLSQALAHCRKSLSNNTGR
jgi:RNA polymerase sigma factor (sigma-70 family)